LFLFVCLFCFVLFLATVATRCRKKNHRSGVEIANRRFYFLCARRRAVGAARPSIGRPVATAKINFLTTNRRMLKERPIEREERKGGEKRVGEKKERRDGGVLFLFYLCGLF